jgi:flagellar protein FliO/FliZ
LFVVCFSFAALNLINAQESAGAPGTGTAQSQPADESMPLQNEAPLQTEAPIQTEAAPQGEAGILLDAPPAPLPDPRAGEANVPVGGGGGALAQFLALLRLVLVLALAAAAAYGVIYFIKKSKKNTLAENPRLRVLASVPVNARTQAAVVAVGQKAYLVGTGDAGLSLIAEVTDKETLDGLFLDYSREGGGAVWNKMSFRSLLNIFGVKAQSQNGAAAGGSAATIEPPAAPDLRAQRERLESL